MQLILIILSVVFIFILILFKYSNKNNFKLKDYSSNMQQNRTFFKDVEGFSFPIGKKVNKSQCKKDAAILKRILKNAITMPVEKKAWVVKLIKNVEKGKITFPNGLNYDRAINLINLNCDDIADLVNIDKDRIMRKVFQSVEPNPSEEVLMEAERHGISKEDLQDWFSRKLADHTVIKGFLKDEQYEKIEEFFKTADVQSLCKKLNEVLDEEQKQQLENEKIKIEHIAKYMLYYGVNTFYRFSKLRRTLPERFFDDKNRGPISKVIKGVDTVNLETFEVSENVNLEPEVKEFIPQNTLSKNTFKNVALVDAFKNHNQIIDTIKKAEKRFIKIPRVLVNFDTHSDIYLDKPAENTIADWVNTVAKDYDITDAYWVVPDVGLFNINTKEFFFGYNAENSKTFRGNYSYNEVYRDLSKPLTQRFLLEKINGTMVMDSVNYSKEEFASYLQTGKYKEIRVHICTKASLPKIKKDFILSIDADFFNNCGFDSDYHTEQLPFDKERAWEEFLEVWNKKMRKATIVGLCISPEYIGFSVLGATRGFYEYILNAVKKYSKKLY